MGSQALVAALRDVFKHSEFKSVLQKEAIECINGGECLRLYPRTIVSLKRHLIRRTRHNISGQVFCNLANICTFETKFLVFRRNIPLSQGKPIHSQGCDATSENCNKERHV